MGNHSDSLDNPGAVYRSSIIHTPDSIQQLGDCLRQEYQQLLGTDRVDRWLPQGLGAVDFQTWSGLEQTIHESLQIVADMLAVEQQLTSGFFPIDVADQTQTVLNAREPEQSRDRNRQQTGKQPNPAIVHSASEQIDSFPFTMLPLALQRPWATSSNLPSDPPPASGSPSYKGRSDHQYPDHQPGLSNPSLRTTQSNLKSALKSANIEWLADSTLPGTEPLNTAPRSLTNFDQEKSHPVSPPSVFAGVREFGEPASDEFLPPTPSFPKLPTHTHERSPSQDSKHWPESHDSEQEPVASNRRLSADRVPLVNSNLAAMESADGPGAPNLPNFPRLSKSGKTLLSTSHTTAPNPAPKLEDNLQPSSPVSVPRVVTGLRAVAQALEAAPDYLQNEESDYSPRFTSPRFTDVNSPPDGLPIASMDVAEPTPLTQSAVPSVPSVPTRFNQPRSPSQDSKHWPESHDSEQESVASNRRLSANRVPLASSDLTVMESADGPDAPNFPNFPRLSKSGKTLLSASHATAPNPAPKLEDNLQPSSPVSVPRVVTGLRAVAQALEAAPDYLQNEEFDHSYLPTEHSVNYPFTAPDAWAENALVSTENEGLPLPDAIAPSSSQPSWAQLQAANATVGQAIATPLPINTVPLAASKFPATPQWQEDSPAASESSARHPAALDLDQVLDALSREIVREYHSFYGD